MNKTSCKTNWHVNFVNHLTASSRHTNMEQNLQQGICNCELNRIAFKKALQKQQSQERGPTNHTGTSKISKYKSEGGVHFCKPSTGK
jgi:hypothetical protein